MSEVPAEYLVFHDTGKPDMCTCHYPAAYYTACRCGMPDENGWYRVANVLPEPKREVWLADFPRDIEPPYDLGYLSDARASDTGYRYPPEWVLDQTSPLNAYTHWQYVVYPQPPIEQEPPR